MNPCKTADATAATNSMDGYRIRRIESIIVDLPIRRPHKTGAMTMGHQSSLIVELETSDGVTGIGEAVVPGGGPGWGGESVESMKQIVDHYLSPALLEKHLRGLNDAISHASSGFRGASFAFGGMEMALWDLHGKRHNISLADMFGGLIHDRIPVLWSIGANVEDPFTEASMYVAAGHRTVKFMLGVGDPRAEVTRVLDVARQLPSDVLLTVDCNGHWDEDNARRLLPVLADGGVRIAEQPLAAWDSRGSQRLRELGVIEILADESVRSVADLMRVVQTASADLVAIKVPKLGGLGRAQTAAALAESAGLRLWAGGTMETSIGTSAAAQIFGSWGQIAGCDLIGPLLMTDDVVTNPVRYVDGALVIPRGPGLGVDLDHDKVRHYARR